MCLMTPIGFFSIVQKPDDRTRNTLTIRTRVKGDLERFKQFIEARGHETGAWRGDVDADT